MEGVGRMIALCDQRKIPSSHFGVLSFYILDVVHVWCSLLVIAIFETVADKFQNITYSVVCVSSICFHRNAAPWWYLQIARNMAHMQAFKQWSLSRASVARVYSGRRSGKIFFWKGIGSDSVPLRHPSCVRAPFIRSRENLEGRQETILWGNSFQERRKRKLFDKAHLMFDSRPSSRKRGFCSKSPDVTNPERFFDKAKFLPHPLERVFDSP